MIRLLHVRSGQGLYGAERSLLTLASATRPPLQPAVASLVRPGREDVLGAEARRLGLETLRIDAPGRLSVRALAPLVRASRGALLHAHDYKSLLLGLAAGARSGSPVVATFHGDTGHSALVRRYEALARLGARAAAGVAATSEPLAARLRAAAPRTPVHVIPNGITPGPLPSADERGAARAALEVPPGARVVAFVGRLSPEKGPEILLRAARGTGSLLLFAGEGPLLPALEAEARGAARFLGFVGDVRQVFAAADVLALPSRTEGLPMVVLEAMAAGVPVAASAVGSLPEVLGEGAGLLVPPGDVDALRAALHALERPEVSTAVSAAARARVESRYSAEAMAASYLRLLYQPALERTGGRAAPGASPQVW